LIKKHVLSPSALLSVNAVEGCMDAEREGKDEILVWGTGMARREFIYVEDAAEASQGTEVEGGEAERGNPDSDARWIYHAQQEFAGPVFALEIQAQDLAHNVTTQMLEGDL